MNFSVDIKYEGLGEPDEVAQGIAETVANLPGVGEVRVYHNEDLLAWEDGDA